MPKKKILQVTSYFRYGGVEAYIMNNYRNIDRNKYDFDFWFFDEDNSPYKKEIISLGGNVFQGEIPDIRRIIFFMKSLIKHINNNGPYAVVHSHVNILNGWVMLAAFISGVKIRISHSHGTSGKESNKIKTKLYIKFLEYLIIFFSTKKLACSKEAGSYLYGKRYFLQHGEVVNNGIDIDGFLYKNDKDIFKIKEEFNIEENNLIIGNITRFDNNKNQEFIIEVFNQLLKIEPNSILILGGVDDGRLSYIKKKAKDYKIEDKIKFIGVRTDVKDWLKIIDVYLLPSLSEGLPVAILEAQAAGVKSIISSGISKEVDLGLDLVDFLDLEKGPEIWAKHILKSVGKSEVKSGVIIKEFNNSGYSIKTSVKKIEEIYNKK